MALVGDKKAPHHFIDEVSVRRTCLEEGGADRLGARVTSIAVSLPRPLLAVFGIVR